MSVIQSQCPAWFVADKSPPARFVIGPWVGNKKCTKSNQSLKNILLYLINSLKLTLAQMIALSSLSGFYIKLRFAFNSLELL